MSAKDQDRYVEYTVRIHRDSLAQQNMAKHAHRFHHRYKAGWLAMLIEEFYLLLEGPDPQASVLYSLLYPRYRQTPLPARATIEQAQESREFTAHDEQDVQEEEEIKRMSANLEGYLDE